MKGRTGLLFSLIIAAYFCGIAADCENTSKADIVFLVDGSSSISDQDFRKIQTVLRSIVRTLHIGKNKIRVGLVQYSSDPFLEFQLNDHMDKKSLLAALDRLNHRGGGTQTGKAIDFLLTEYFTKQAGSRASERVPQIAVVITDGDSTDGVTEPAKRLRQHGVIVFGIGVGQVNKKQLESIVNWPPHRFLRTIDNYEALQAEMGHLLQTVCVTMEEQSQALAERFADIFFLVDSGIGQGHFTQFKTELQTLIDQLNVRASTYRIGLAQYGQDTEVEFLLNAFQNKQETLNAVKRFRLSPKSNEPPYLGRALENARTHFFTSEVGGRAEQGFRQFLVVVSGQASSDPVYSVARRIKLAGVTVIGMSAGAPMHKISLLSDQYAFDSVRVTHLKDLFMTEEEVITQDCKTGNVADIVFIVDESTSIGIDNFSLVRNFLHSIVSSLAIKTEKVEKVQVGIVTYNETSTAQAYLNTFDDKTEILQFIKLLPYNGGNTNTGKALNFTRDMIFTKEKGSRKGVQQVAVVITDGESQDNVSDAAIILRRTGVTVFAVGIGNAKKKELDKMASHPSSKHVFYVDSFTHLKPLKEILQENLCRGIIEKQVADKKRKEENKKACVQKDEADIFFLIDESGSILNSDFDDMKNFIIEFLHTFNVGPHNNRIGLVKYADSPNLEFDLTAHKDADALEKAVKGISHKGGGTNTGKALSDMVRHFKRHTHGQSGNKVPQYLIVITDGQSQDGVKAPAEKLREQDVIIYAIGVKESNKTELDEISGDPDRTFSVTTFDALKTLTNDIITDICSPDVCKGASGDVIFLTDSSESISDQDFQKMKVFMKSVINKIDIQQDGVHVGVMQFSTNYELQFSLNEYYSKDEMFKNINNMAQMKEGTRTGSAITAVSQYFNESRGGRPGVTQRLVVITDGKSNDDVRHPAADLSAKGVVIYAIGVMDANITELLDISGEKERVYVGRNFDALNDWDSQVALKICESDCKENGADVIFLVDGSAGKDFNEFNSMHKFMESIVGLTTVGKNWTQFGVILYADDAKSVFTLGRYYSKRELLEKIRAVKPIGGRTNTAKALAYSLQFFDRAHGGRAGKSKILIVITDRIASDRNDLKKASDALKKEEVNVLSIGTENTIINQLMIMSAGNTSRVFTVANYNALEGLKSVSPVFCSLTKPVCRKDRADLVFLLDKSSSINPHNHTVMLNFTSELVKRFKIGQEFVRIGAAQFSDDPQHEFYLNDYNNKEDVIAHILKMKHTGVNTYLGKALDYMKDYFTKKRGCRMSDSFPRKLVLFSDGDSHDDVEDAARRLRGEGVEIIAIGVGDVHILQLLQITDSPERVFSVNNFDSLKNIHEKVINAICEDDPGDDPDVIPPDPVTYGNCSIDIAIGFDISQRDGFRKLRAYLPEIVRHVSSVQVSNTEVKTNIAFHLVDRYGNSLIDTNFEEYSVDVLEKVMQISEPTYFNTNLMNSFKKMFQDKSKARVKVLVIFSDGLDENMENWGPQSQLQKSMSAEVSALLIVALEGAHNPVELQNLEFGRGFSYNHPLSITMTNIASTINKQITTVSERVCCNITCMCWGNDGIGGSPGRPGIKGEPGKRGHTGFLGEEGHAGERGPPGPVGPQGTKGCVGNRGEKGSGASSGDWGEKGEAGLDGINGEQGVIGLNGSRGEKGHPGNPGIPGIPGDRGLKGERGLSGDSGEPGISNNKKGTKGESGSPGPLGKPGPDGKGGEDGIEGNPGLHGRRGPLGQKGRPGEPGDPGLQGSPGASGPQGRSGGNGERGPKGTFGFPGPQGAHGKPGGEGQVGHRGANGQKGQPGDPGIKGGPGSQGPRGMPGQDGRDGSGFAGPKGAKGDPGFPGHPGLQGEEGFKGTKGYPGRNGNQGRRGNSGRPGESGRNGDPGYPGHIGPRGPPGDKGMTECELITYIRDNCACCQGKSKCPAYPTELVFGLDMLQNVTEADFKRQHEALVSLLDDISIAESNCPTGARVAVVAYSNRTNYLIRFQDYRHKTQLMESVKKITFVKEVNSREYNLGDAMHFVAQSVFKRTRAGAMMRKVAVFFSNRQEDRENIISAIMKYHALNIVPVIISLNSQASEVDDTGHSIFTVLGRNLASDLRKVKNCAICFDPCRRTEECTSIQKLVQPQQVDVDLVMVADSSREVQVDEYAGMQQLSGSVVEQLVVSIRPDRAGHQARVAVVQQSSGRTKEPKLEFGLQQYQNHQQMKRHLIQTMQQQGGSSALGKTLEYSLMNVLLKASRPRKKRALLIMMGTQVADKDWARLHFISQKAKCEGVAMFVVTVGGRYNRTQVEELASGPVRQHLIHVGQLKAQEQGYVQRFFRVFLAALNNGKNLYPPNSLKSTCNQLTYEDQPFFNGDGSAEQMDEGVEERVEEQMGVKTWTRELDVIDTLIREDGESFLSGVNLNEACLIKKETGSCQNYTLKWFFDSKRGECSQFWYSGCDGNSNRFETQKACETVCLTKI